MPTVIEAQKISINYGKSEPIKSVSFKIQNGDFIGLIGPNGAGKTTLIKALLGLLPIAKGEILLYGKPLKQFSDWHRIDYLPQNIKTINPLFPATIEEVVFLGLLSSKKTHRHFSASDKARVKETLIDLEIVDLKSRTISELSGGQQQKVLIARALVSKPEILILDEPTTALDSKSREEFMGLIKDLNKKNGITIILITHDTNLVCQHVSKLMYVDKKMMFFGSVRDFYHSKNRIEMLDDYGKHVIYHHKD
jgi:zinc transport system ATP-binding protein